MATRIPAWLQRSIKRQTTHYLTETCTIEKQPDTTDQYGVPSTSPDDNWTLIASGVKCQVITVGRSRQGNAGIVGSQESLQDEVRIVVTAGTELDVNYRIKVGGITYNVVRLETDRSAETDCQAICTRQR